jgi:hypothetical protein
MPPKKVDEPFQISGSDLWFQRSGGKIHSRRIDGSRLGVTVAVPVKGWSDADRDAKIRAHKDFAELTAHAAAAKSGQLMEVEVEKGPAVQSTQAIGQRELRAMEEASVLVNDARNREQTDFFMHSEHSMRDDYDASRLGSRHSRVRDVSYVEATQKLEQMGLEAEAWLHEVRRIITQMDVILGEIPPEHAPAARALQEALMEMVGDAEDEDESGGEGEEGEVCESCESCESSKPVELSTAEQCATAYFEEVAAAVSWSSEGPPPEAPLAVLKASLNGCAGGLLLTPYELLWIAAGSHFSEAKLRVQLRDITSAKALLSKSPFGSRAELLVARKP